MGMACKKPFLISFLAIKQQFSSNHGNDNTKWWQEGEEAVRSGREEKE